MEVSQARLVLGYRHGVTYGSGDYAGMVMLHGLLGAFSHSRLFQEVREKASLAYEVHTHIERTKGLLFVEAGIAAENEERVVEIVRAQIESLGRGTIHAEEFSATRESYLNALSMLEDSPGELLAVDRIWRQHGRAFDLEGWRADLRSVTTDRVAEAARLLQLDTVFFLRK